MKKIIILIFLSIFIISCNNNKISEEEIKIEKQKIEKKNIISRKEKQEILWNKNHIKTPKKVWALYYSYSWINNEKKFQNLLKIAKNTSINSVIIDIKEVDWKITLDNLDEILKTLHWENIYTIARIVVFKDNLLTEKRPDLAYKWIWNKNKVWTDYSGNKYLDANSKEVWDYNAEIASQAYEMWFDEINFDYVRFPSDWKISKIYAPFSKEILAKNWNLWKIKVINNFSKYITDKLRKKYPKIVISADVFWLVTNWDLSTIWQSLEWFLQNFDFVAPMTYPSHYWYGFLWFKYPDNHPYEVITDALKNSYSKINKYNLEKNNIKNLDKKQIRLWLQWFSCTWCKNSTPYMDYKFKLQTKAIRDNNGSGFVVWNANSNYYQSWYK